jgi:hypothetical protein
MKAYGGVDVQIHVFLTSELVWGEWSASRPGRFTTHERASRTHWIGGWVGPRAGLDDVEKRKFLPLPGLEHRPLYRPSLSQTLYRLTYRGLSVKLFIDWLIHTFTDSFVHQWLYSPFVETWTLLQFHTLFYTDGGTPCTGDQAVARPRPTHRTT